MVFGVQKICANKNNELIFSLSKANTVYKKTTEKSLSQVCDSKTIKYYCLSYTT